MSNETEVHAAREGEHGGRAVVCVATAQQQRGENPSTKKKGKKTDQAQREAEVLQYAQKIARAAAQVVRDVNELDGRETLSEEAFKVRRHSNP